ncbi:hypothetical protein GGR50DRAFT_689204 [Xylaria sp. CBS 124048]|nr:hypothetical protein GGR50DRAFT_689204 [Xylaria sp. CBS 124048]
MPAHPAAHPAPLSAMYDNKRPSTSATSEGESHVDNLSVQYSHTNIPYCYSRQDVYVKRWSRIYIILVILSLYSTLLSGLWLGVSIFQPRYGRTISSGHGWQVAPSTATLLATLFAKSIELTFVTVFVAVLGQVLTRRAFSRHSRGVTLAELTMRNWVLQPGSLLTHWEGLPQAAPTVLGVLTLIATLCGFLYTTASDAMVSPKLKRHDWTMSELKGLVKVSYADPFYVSATCQTPLDKFDAVHGPEACLDVLFAGQSYHSLIAYMAEWDGISNPDDQALSKLSGRPTGKHTLTDNTTMDSSWIEAEYGDMASNFMIYRRIINNVTLAMPHPGVYTAATDPINNILQPNELLGLGEYSIRASVVSPAVNVMCANMNKDELVPIIYTEWPEARTTNSSIPGQKIGEFNYMDDIPPDSPTEWLNRTAVDDVFKWGQQYGRRPPVFQMYPIDYNMITYTSNAYADSLYVLGKSGNLTDYTLCQLRSWVTPKCSTEFDMSGTAGGSMKAHCEDPNDINAYERVYPKDAANTPMPSGDWRNTAEEWRLAINLNAGTENSNASNARVLTSLALEKPELSAALPSMAEAIAVLATSTLVAGAQDSTFKANFTYAQNPIPSGTYETFRAQMQTQQYASAHTSGWQVVFYPILAAAFGLNLLCFVYLVFGTAFTSSSSGSSASVQSPYADKKKYPPLSPNLAHTGRRKHLGTVKEAQSEPDSDTEALAGDNGVPAPRKAAKGLVTDYTEPQNLFALTINSPPSRSLAGSCGHGPDRTGMRVPWRVGYSAGANHYFLEEMGGEEQEQEQGKSSGLDLSMIDDGRYAESYIRLSSRKTWL